MRRTAAASVLALGTFAAPVNAQQTVIFNDPNFQPQGQVLQQPLPQNPNQPIFIVPPQPQYGQPLQQPGFVQPQQFQGQPQPNFGQQIPQPQQVFQPPRPPVQPQPQATVPYYENTGTPAQPTPQIQPQNTDLAAPSQPITVAPVVQQPAQTAPLAAPVSAERVSDRAPQMSVELSTLIRAAERYRAASPGFLDDLKLLAEKFREPLPEPIAPPTADPLVVTSGSTDPDQAEAPAFSDGDVQGGGTVTALPGPSLAVERLGQGSLATLVFLEDYFDDGEIEFNPPWAVRQGDWILDPIYGLRAKRPDRVSNETIKPKELLNVLLGGNAPSNDTSAKPQAALIETQAVIGNAFSLEARIVDHEGKGAAHFIMHQGGANWLGYRLELRSGPRPVVVLTRRGSNGYKDITKVQAPGFTKGKTHELRWVRLSSGKMLVILNGQPLITSRDTVFRDDWKGFAFFNAGGDVSMRALRVAAPVER